MIFVIVVSAITRPVVQLVAGNKERNAPCRTVVLFAPATIACAPDIDVAKHVIVDGSWT
jgi:hypothetical protein